MTKSKKPTFQQLIGAINRHDVQSLQKLLIEGADPNTTMDSSYYGNISVLMCAAGVQFLEGVETLLAAGAKANFCSIAGSGGGGERTALYEAITGTNNRPSVDTKKSSEEHRLKIVDALLKAGANPNEVGKGDRLPLYAAAHDGYYEICHRLIEAGATFKTWPPQCPPPLVGAAGGGPLHSMSEGRKQDRVAKFLLDLGAPVDGETANGGTALMASVLIGNEPRTKLFVSVGANVNHQDAQYGRTPLICAALYSDWHAFDEETQQLALRIVKELLDSGANPAVRNTEGENAFDIASHGKSSLVADYIKEFTENRYKAK